MNIKAQEFFAEYVNIFLNAGLETEIFLSLQQKKEISNK